MSALSAHLNIIHISLWLNFKLEQDVKKSPEQCLELFLSYSPASILWFLFEGYDCPCDMG